MKKQRNYQKKPVSAACKQQVTPIFHLEFGTCSFLCQVRSLRLRQDICPGCSAGKGRSDLSAWLSLDPHAPSCCAHSWRYVSSYHLSLFDWGPNLGFSDAALAGSGSHTLLVQTIPAASFLPFLPAASLKDECSMVDSSVSKELHEWFPCTVGVRRLWSPPASGCPCLPPGNECSASRGQGGHPRGASSQPQESACCGQQTEGFDEEGSVCWPGWWLKGRSESTCFPLWRANVQDMAINRHTS